MAQRIKKVQEDISNCCEISITDVIAAPENLIFPITVLTSFFVVHLLTFQALINYHSHVASTDSAITSPRNEELIKSVCSNHHNRFHQLRFIFNDLTQLAYRSYSFANVSKSNKIQIIWMQAFDSAFDNDPILFQ